MKKITLSVAALTIAMSSYGQCVLSTSDSLQIVSEDMIGWIQYDVENGRIYQEYADLYIENLLTIISKTEDLITIKE
jgi:hypothetical protein